MSDVPPAPLQVQSLYYSPPPRVRPSVVTAMGVMSLIIGAASMLINGILLLQVNVMYQTSRMAAAMANVSLPTPAADISEVLPLRGMPVADRKIVAAGLGNVRTLSEQRLAQLDLLLAEGGKDIVLLAGAGLNQEAVAANVSDSAKVPGIAGREGPDVFVVGSGRIELYDDHAVFFPTRGEPIRVAGLREDSSGTKILGTNQINLIEAKIEKLAGAKLNEAQSTALRTTLTSPGEQLVTPTASMADIAAQVQYATAQDDGSILIGFASAAITLDSVGKVTAFSSSLGGMSAKGPGGKKQNFAINAAAGGLAIADCIISILLAVYLCLAGILVFRESREGGRHHRIYAWIKLPVAMAAGIIWAWLWSSFLRIIQTAGGGSMTSNQSFAVKMVMLAGLAIGLCGAIYPIILLLLLRGKTMRDYYGGIVESA